MIDLRSDTATQPTEGMRQAIARARVGDEQKREDPSVNDLQERVAYLLGQEAAIFVPTATMANQIALKLHGRPGDVLIAEQTAHVVIAAREIGLAVHLDGARLLNASVALGVEPSAVAARFDTVTLCLSKGLGCPLGALLVGSRELMSRAWREKHLFGGAMRQAGVVAAAGLYALDHHIERLAEDHERARTLARTIHGAGVPIDLDQVETNFVQIDAARLGFDRADALARLSDSGVGLSTTIHPTVMRAVTHLDVTDDDIERASALIPEALLAGVRA